MGKRSIQSSLFACLALLVVLFAAQPRDVAAHTLDHVGVEASIAAEVTVQPEASNQVYPLHNIGHHQHSDNDGSNTTGLCCVASCSAWGITAYTPGALIGFESEHCAPA